MLQIEDFVNAQLYKNKDAVIQDALRHLLRNRPDFRVQLAIYRYQQESVSLAKAAELAGVSWWQMRDILLEQGIDPALGPETTEEAQVEVDQLRNYVSSNL